MKLCVVFLSVVTLLVPLNGQHRSISSQIVDYIEGLREQMPCGFPSRNIPPLAPLKTQHRDIAIDTGAFKLTGEINDFRLDGLDEFIIEELKVSAITSKMNFVFNWPNVNCTTKYAINGTTTTPEKARESNAKFALKGFKIWGLCKYALGVLGGKLRVKELSVYASVDDVKSEIEDLSKYKIVNRKLNEIIEEWVKLAINGNTDNFAVFSNEIVVPIINNFIGDRSLSDIIGGGGGGNGGEPGSPGGTPVEKVPCIPEKH